MYVWDNTTNNYLFWTTEIGGTKGNGVIPIGQGFFVRSIASPAKLTIPTDAITPSFSGIYKCKSGYESYANNYC